jgi:hypothetical protein
MCPQSLSILSLPLSRPARLPQAGRSAEPREDTMTSTAYARTADVGAPARTAVAFRRAGLGLSGF